MKLASLFGMLLVATIWVSCQYPDNPSKGYDPGRFQFEDLVSNLNEPMELDFLPDGRILFIERRGLLKLYDPQTHITRVVGEIPVNYINENGLLGMAIDPHFEDNSWIFFFYTDPARKAYQQVSRFDFVEDQLVLESEKKVLDFYIDYENCCHFGGSLAFGPEGDLFISSGDNVGGKDYAPIDERPGRELHDSQRSSGNSNDLRGAILRIKPEADGTYSIPEGNLFPVGTPQTRPEIYVMGTRNPLKIEVDPMTGWLYWGDVGPNPGWKYKDWGPPSYEEVNQAQEAGNYGWPYLLGDNQAFRDLDFATQSVGEFFDPLHLINNSPNNTGIRELPVAQKALIWYPNTASDSFPLVGAGGGTVCAGPIYHFQSEIKSAGKWPSHFDKKLFIFEWMRSWVLAVELDEQGAYRGMENPFGSNPFKKPIDVSFGPDGAMYVLDYGSNWYAQNADARLTRVSYIYGNRAPVARIKASQLEGAAPLEVQFSAATSTDIDTVDQLSYSWSFENSTYTSSESFPTHTFQSPGIHKVRLIVRDNEGLSDTAYTSIRIGNEPPDIQVYLGGNQTFFRSGKPIPYSVRVQDLEDGSTSDGSIGEERVQVRLRQLKSTTNVATVKEVSSLESSTLSFLRGKQLMEGSDCYACHAREGQSVGPSFRQVSEKYQKDTMALKQLSQKILLGGSGIWGEKQMPAHPQHSLSDVKEMVQYILSLSQAPIKGEPIPLKGSLSTRTLGIKHLLLLTSSYIDQGGGGQAPISREVRTLLRPTLVPAVAFDEARRIKAKPINEQGDLYAEVALNGCYAGFYQIDLTGVQTVRAKIRSTSDWVAVEMRQGSPEGRLLDKQRKELGFKENKWAPYKEEDWFYMDLTVPANSGKEDLYFVFSSSKLPSEYIYYDICQVYSFEFLFENTTL
ncbi:MAG: PQQ-dependent sugar dehydrogenase [Bacteroidota bacterium]